MAEGKKNKNIPGDGVLSNNRKALHDYIVLEQYEAGIQLTGTEVKSCRARTVTLSEAYVDMTQGSAFLVNAHIAGYDHGNRFNHDTRRRRRLLLHKKEIQKLIGKIAEKGYTLVPVEVYLSNGLVKVQIALAKGKKLYDKRQDIAKKDLKREAQRDFKVNMRA